MTIYDKQKMYSWFEEQGWESLISYSMANFGGSSPEKLEKAKNFLFHYVDEEEIEVYVSNFLSPVRLENIGVKIEDSLQYEKKTATKEIVSYFKWASKVLFVGLTYMDFVSKFISWFYEHNNFSEDEILFLINSNYYKIF